MSFLSKISNLRKSNPVLPTKADPPSSPPVTYQAPSLLPKSYTRKEDPAVRRLKEKRQKELLKKGELSKKAHASRRASAPKMSTRKDFEDDNRTETRFKKISGKSVAGFDRPTHISAVQMKRPGPIKKMSFEELMRQADSNANMKVNNTSNGHSPIPVNAPSKFSSRSAKQCLKNSDRGREANLGESVKIGLNSAIGNQRIPVAHNIRLPRIEDDFAKPNEFIRRRLEAKKKASRKVLKTEIDHYGDDMDDFIDDEDEAATSMERGLGYDRDEIWALFNRGKKRSDYEFDDDDENDMEANEMEIIEEEERARKMAKLEDKREEEWLRRHDMQKKRRKKVKY